MASQTFRLFRGFPAKPKYVWSQFVTKLEARFRFAGIAYEIDQGNPLQGPRGKIPYLSILKDADDAAPKIVSDTALISKMLVTDGLAEDLNAGLAPVEKARDLALRALLEDKLVFYQQYERWVQNYYTTRPTIFAFLPYPLQIIVGQLAYRKITATLYGQGTTRFTADEITKFKTEIWESINALLVASRQQRNDDDNDDDDHDHDEDEDEHEKKLFWVLGGKGPTEADTTLFGFVASNLVCDAAPETRGIIKRLPAVMEYAEGIHRRYFADYEHWG